MSADHEETTTVSERWATRDGDGTTLFHTSRSTRLSIFPQIKSRDSIPSLCHMLLQTNIMGPMVRCSNQLRAFQLNDVKVQSTRASTTFVCPWKKTSSKRAMTSLSPRTHCTMPGAVITWASIQVSALSIGPELLGLEAMQLRVI
jgi:hypothetical protein